MALLQSSIPRRTPFTCERKGSATVRARTQPRGRGHTLQACALPDDQTTWGKALRVAVTGVLASGVLWLSPSPAQADVQTVSPQMVTQMARPLPKQTVDKGKIWTVFIGGAAVLFVGTVVLENNPQFFPAISRANQAYREATKRMKEEEELAKKQEELLRLRQQEYDSEQRQVDAVKQGLKQAKAKVLAASPGTGSAAAQAPTQTVPVAAAPAAAAPAAALAAPAALSEAGLAAQTVGPTAAAPAVAAAAEGTQHSDSPASAGVTAGSLAAVAAAIASSNPAAAEPPVVPAGPSYVVVEDTVPDMGAVAWPAAGGPSGNNAEAAAPAPAVSTAAAGGADGPLGASASPGAGAGATEAAGDSPEGDAEALARLARLQGFVSGTMAGSKGVMEAYKAQRQ